MGTVHLFEAVRRLGTPCAVVNVTSDKCYAHRASGPAYRENDPMGGDDPYSNSKGCAELVTTAWRHSYFPTGDARQARRGARQCARRERDRRRRLDRRSADSRSRSLLRRKAACPIRRPDGIRPWQFVLEPLRGYLLLAERLAADGAHVRLWMELWPGGLRRATRRRGSPTGWRAVGGIGALGCATVPRIRRRRRSCGSTRRRRSRTSAGSRRYRWQTARLDRRMVSRVEPRATTSARSR